MYDEYMNTLFDRRPPQIQPQPMPQMPVKVGEIFMYVVNRGDNVYAIARRFNSSVDFIKCMNRLDDNAMIHPGQRLLVPVLFTNQNNPNPPMKPQPRQSYELYF